jgi:glycosyltransferase involved in cell wall biosynthesis
MKILILMAYCNRPKMVEIPLRSIQNQSYKNWELAFVDDGSLVSGEYIVKTILSDDLDKVKFYNTHHTPEDKIKNGGSVFGRFWNEAMYESDADIAIMLCDDDALYPEYLQKLVDYYSFEQSVNYSYGHVSVFNPNTCTNLDSLVLDRSSDLNKTGQFNPVCQVDASQVSWRIDKVKENNITFPVPKTTDLDAAIYNAMFSSFGNCVYNGIIAQYKGVHLDQMGNRTHDLYDIKDIM